MRKLLDTPEAILARERYHAGARRRQAQGLTVKGQPRVREFLSAAEDKRRRLARWHERSTARVKRGLTTRGTPKKTRIGNHFTRSAPGRLGVLLNNFQGDRRTLLAEVTR